MNKTPVVLSSALLLLAAAPAFGAAVVYNSAGATAAITVVRDQFRADVGGGTAPGANGSFGGLRREINWDGVPDGLATPNNLPLNFFNVNSPRGAVFSTPGTGVAVSANAGSVPIEFGNFNASYASIFVPFSAQRLFAALGSNVVDVDFFVPGTTTPGFTTAFASIFTDVDLDDTTAIEYFSDTTSLGRFAVQAADNGLSFMGVRFNAGERITRARIISGNAVLGSNDRAGVDVVVMDDFLFAEVRAVPEPSSMLLVSAAMLALGLARRRAGATERLSD